MTDGSDTCPDACIEAPAAAPRIDSPHAVGDQLVVALKVGAAVISFLLIGSTLWWQAQHPLAISVYDDVFDRVRLYRSLGSFSQILQYLTALHNEHRILTTRLLTLLDEFVFYGREHTQVTVCNTLQLVSGIFAYRIAFKPAANDSPNVAQIGLGVSTILLLFINPNFIYTLFVPFQVQHAIMTFLCLVAAWLVSRFSLSSQSSDEKRRLLLWLVILAVVASFTLGNAPVILIAAAAIAIVSRWRIRMIIILTLLAIAHTAITLATSPGIGASAFNPIGLLKFALLYLGAPFMRFAPWPAAHPTWWSSAYLAAALGAVVLGTAIGFAVWRFANPRVGGRIATFGLALLLAVVVTGLAAAHSRLQFGVLEGTNKKYASFAGLGWLGVLAVAIGLARDRFTRFRWAETAVYGAMLAVLLPLTVMGYFRETAIWERMADANWENALAAFMQVNDRDRLHGINNDDVEFAQYLTAISSRNSGIFSYFSFRWGDKAGGVLGSLRETECRGSIESLDSIPEAYRANLFQVPGTPATMSGWAWIDKDHAPALTVIAVASDDRIVGAARSTRRSTTAEQMTGRMFRQNVGWFGLARLVEPPPVRFFALSRDNRHYCALGAAGFSH